MDADWVGPVNSQKKRTLRSGSKRKSEGLEQFENLKGEYEKKYLQSEGWQENINVSVSLTLRKIQTKEAELKNQYNTLRKMESAVMSYQKTLETKEREMDEKCRKKMQAFEDEKERMRKLHSIPDNIIKLNIGGQHFTTSKTTLCSDTTSMFAAMFSGHHKLTKCEDGTYFIDADGTHFQWILNFLRGRITSMTDLPKDKSILNWLKAESDFYQLSGLQELIKNALDSQSPTTLSQDWIDDFFFGYRSRGEMNFSNMNLSNISFENFTFYHNASFENTNLTGASFHNCLFRRGITINFFRADLKDCDFTYTKEEDDFSYTAKELVDGKYNVLELEGAINLDKIKADFDIMKLIVEGSINLPSP